LNKKFWKSKLGIKLIASALFSILCAFAVYSVISMFEHRFYLEKSKDWEYMQVNTQKQINKFQNYIADNNLSMTDINAINDWVRNKKNIILFIYDDDKMVYDSTVLNLDEQKSIEQRPIKPDNHFQKEHYRKLHNIKFKDKDVKAEMICFFEYKYRIIMNYIKVNISGLCFIVVFFLLIKKRTEYIYQLENEVNILEGGNLNYKITVKGDDELAYLAKSIDDMRISFIERQNNEIERITYNHKFVTAMSHDLRTPLTVLIGLLEILDGKKYKDESQLEEYINKSLKKAYHIKNLSDKIFEYFLAFNIEEDNLNMESFNCSVINEVIGDYLFSINEKGYKFEFKPIKENIKLFMDMQYIHRVFDNIFSNIIKYSDKKNKIDIDYDIKDGYLYIYQTNYINKNIENVESTNIGLEVCKRIMMQHNGDFYTQKDNTIFKTTVKFKVE